jgi:ABC-type phosphate transport system substrate-binding protein
LPPIDTGAAAPFAMEQMMMRSILKLAACAAAVLALYACASTNSRPYEGSQGESPTAAGTSDVHPPYESRSY